MYISITFTFAVLFTAKLSILILYRRIFSVSRYRTISMVCMVVSSAWFVAIFITMLTICTPIDRFWHPGDSGSCHDFSTFFLIVGVFEIILDSAILAIPVWGTISLNMAFRTRLVVLSIFLVGFL